MEGDTWKTVRVSAVCTDCTSISRQKEDEQHPKTRAHRYDHHRHEQFRLRSLLKLAQLRQKAIEHLQRHVRRLGQDRINTTCLPDTLDEKGRNLEGIYGKKIEVVGNGRVMSQGKLKHEICPNQADFQAKLQQDKDASIGRCGDGLVEEHATAKHVIRKNLEGGEDRPQNDVDYNEGFRLFLTQMGAKKQHVKNAPLEEKTDNNVLGNSIELVDPRSLYQLQLPKLRFARTVTNYKLSITWLLENNLILGRKFETYLGAKWKIAKWNRAKKWEMAK
jgi:hypothetical protein